MVAVGVARGTADITDRTAEELLFLQTLDAAQDRLLRAGDHMPPLMRHESAESASAGTPPHGRNGVADRFKRGNPLLVGRMRPPCVGKFTDAVEFGG